MSLTSEQYIEQLSVELKKLAGKLPLGFEYLRLTGQSPHPGGVDYMGQTATRAMYSDLWVWLNENKPDAIVSEEEWQSLYISQNGNVAKYSTGDGATTFRFPRVVGYFKGSDAVSEVGKYMKEGLPNITAAYINNGIGNQAGYTGAFYSNETRSMSYAVHNATTADIPLLSFDASRSSSVYSDDCQHVIPETITVVMGVIAFGVVGSIGESTEEGIVAELGEHRAKLGELESGVANAVPAGTVIAFAANKAPDGFLLCNGATVSCTTYAKLYEAIGTTYGTGDGSSTFALPNLTDKFIQGSGTAGTSKEAGLPNITGTFATEGSLDKSAPTGAFYRTGTSTRGAPGDGTDHIIGLDASRSSAIYGASDTVQPPALTMRYYIKY